MTNLYRTAPEIIEHRREAVARLRLRGMSERTIADALPKMGVINPETDRPWGRTTIQRDLEAVSAEWRKNTQRDIAEHQAAQLATLNEVQAQAWTEKNLELVLKAHDRIAKLLGTNAPDNIQVDAHISADVLAETERRLIILSARATGSPLPDFSAPDTNTLPHDSEAATGTEAALCAALNTPDTEEAAPDASAQLPPNP